MNQQQIQALRQLNAERLAGAPADPALAQLRAQYRAEEAIFEQIIRKGTSSMSNAQLETIRNSMRTTEGASGGYAVPATVSSSVFERMKEVSSVRRVATIETAFSGAPMSYPTYDFEEERGVIHHENTEVTEGSIYFDSVPWQSHKYSSGVFPVTVELISDSAVDMVGFLERRIAFRIGRRANASFTVGNGSTESPGVVNSALVGKVGAEGQTASVTLDDLEDLMASVPAQSRESVKCVWMMHDTTLAAIGKLKDSSGRPLKLVKWGSNALGVPTTLLGFPVEINPDMPVMAAGAKSILFGDFSAYVIRDVGAVTFYRMDDSAYLEKGQVGFMGHIRSGGVFAENLKKSIKAYQNAEAAEPEAA